MREQQKALNETIRKAITGDKSSFEELYHMFAKSILFTVNNLLDDKEAVYDLAQDIVLEMWKRIGTLKEPKAFRSWMHIIIRRMCYDANAKNLKTLTKASHLDIDELADVLEDTDDDIDPIHFTEKGMMAKALADIIELLPQARKQVIIMYYYDGMNTKEIAVALGVTKSTVQTNLMRARNMMFDEMEKRKRERKAMEAAIPMGLAIHADKIVPTEQLGHFIEVCDKSLEVTSFVGHAAAKFATKSLTNAICGGIVATTIAAGGIYFAINYNSEQPVPEPAAAEEVVPTLDAEIEFLSDSGTPSFNPHSVSLSLPEPWHTESWSIRSGDVVAMSSESELLDLALGHLPAGEYRIECIVRHASGTGVRVARSFTIS